MSLINFDTANKVEEPTLVLAYKSGQKIGTLTNITDIHVKPSMNDAPQITFVMHGTETPYWAQMTTFKLVWYKEMDEWFEAVVELNQSSDGVSKTVTLTRLGESELSNVHAYGLEVNSETDIAREDYEPTVLYNPNDENHSLMHRILSHAPHYSVGSVDTTIASLQRTFSMNDKSVWDCFKEVAEEMGVLFIPHNRTVNAYDLLSTCNDCGYRGKFTHICPKCQSTDVTEGYGKDTGICVSTDALGTSITVIDNTDDMKNCLHLSGGDEDMTAAIRNANPNGSGYIWAFTDEMMSEMSPDLAEKYGDYKEAYNDAMTDVIPCDADDYNDLVDKYNDEPYGGDFEKIETIEGYPLLIKAWYDSVDLETYLQTSLMPSIDNDGITAQDVADTLTSSALSPVAIGNLENISLSAASTAVLNAAKLVANPHYEVSVYSTDEYPKLANNTWKGYLLVKNFFDDVNLPEDEKDKAVTELITVTVNDNYESYVSQKVKKALYNYTEGNTGAAGMFAKTVAEVAEEAKLYSLDELNNLNQAFQGAIDILTEQRLDDPGRLSPDLVPLYQSIFVPTKAKKEKIEAEIAVREGEVEIVKDMETFLLEKKADIQEELNLENFFGSTLWIELNAFRREESYSDDNYISDNLDSAELIARAYEFVQTAEQKLSERNQYSYQINSTMQNLLAIPDFANLRDDFEIGNWIRIQTKSGELYKLRLIDYEMDWGAMETLSVTFADVTNTSNIRTIQSVITDTSNLLKNRKRLENQTKRKFVALTDDSKADTVKNNNITNDILWDSLDSTNFSVIKAKDEFESEIKATEKEIQTRVARYSRLWIIPDGMVVSGYGYGDPNVSDDAPENPQTDDIYIDQETGEAWQFDGDEWNFLVQLDSISEDLQSQIIQTAEEIELKVDKTDYNGTEIISRINIAPSTVVIEAEKVNLTGYVTVTDLAGSGTTTINGDNITTGKIRSANYSETAGKDFSNAGTEINLTNGTIKTPGVYINGSTGDAKFSGTVYMKEGYIGDSPILTASSDSMLTLEHAHNAWKLRSAPVNNSSASQEIEGDGSISYDIEFPDEKETGINSVYLNDRLMYEGSLNDYIIYYNEAANKYQIIFVNDVRPQLGDTITINFEERYYGTLTAAKHFVVSNDKDAGHNLENDVTGECSIGSITYPWFEGFFKQLTVGYRDLNWTQIVRNLGMRLLAEPKVTKRVEGNKVYFKWTDPSDIKTKQPAPAKWAGTVVMRSEGQPAPWNRFQSTSTIKKLEDVTQRDKYKTTEFEDTVKFGKRYFYGIFPYDNQGLTQFSYIDEVDLRGNFEYVRLMNVEDIYNQYGIQYGHMIFGPNHLDIINTPDNFNVVYDSMAGSAKIDGNLNANVWVNSQEPYKGYIEYETDGAVYMPADINSLRPAGGMNYSARPYIMSSIFSMDDAYVTNLATWTLGYYPTSNELNALDGKELPGGGDNVTNLFMAYQGFMSYSGHSFSPVCGNNVTDMFSAYNYSNAAGAAVCGPNVVNMAFAYNACTSITEAACGDKVENFMNAYYYCTNLRTAVCGNNVTNMYSSYYSCYNLETAACGPNVTDMYMTYHGCNNLTDAVCGDKVTRMYYTYDVCTNLVNAYIGPNVTDAQGAFSRCPSLKIWYWPNQFNCEQMRRAYVQDYEDGTHITHAVESPKNVTNLSDVFVYTSVIYPSCSDYVITMYNTYQYCNNIISPVCGNNVVNMIGTYANCPNIVNPVCGDNVITMENTYQFCNNIVNPVCGDNVINMINTYWDCNNITYPIFGNNVENIRGAYSGCDAMRMNDQNFFLPINVGFNQESWAYDKVYGATQYAIPCEVPDRWAEEDSANCVIRVGSKEQADEMLTSDLIRAGAVEWETIDNGYRYTNESTEKYSEIRYDGAPTAISAAKFEDGMIKVMFSRPVDSFWNQWLEYREVGTTESEKQSVYYTNYGFIYVDTDKSYEIFYCYNTGTGTYRSNKILYVPSEDPCLDFNSTAAFSLGADKNGSYTLPNLEYSTNKNTWTSWASTLPTINAALGSDGKYHIYLRGSGNSYISMSMSNYLTLYLNSSSNDGVRCDGNIESLLDYQTTHPTMDNYCFYRLFYDNSKLISVPKLLATTLSNGCYQYMFQSCINLTSLPEDLLPATTLAENCYLGMFEYCENLISVPELPATILARGCYMYMFSDCYALTPESIPDLGHVVTVGISSLDSMFESTNISCSDTQTSGSVAWHSVADTSANDTWMFSYGINSPCGTQTYYLSVA